MARGETYTPCKNIGECILKSIWDVFILTESGLKAPPPLLTLSAIRTMTDVPLLPGVLDREGNPRKVVNCSCVVVRDWGEESQERSILLNYFQTEQ